LRSVFCSLSGAGPCVGSEAVAHEARGRERGIGRFGARNRPERHPPPNDTLWAARHPMMGFRSFAHEAPGQAQSSGGRKPPQRYPRTPYGRSRVLASEACGPGPVYRGPRGREIRLFGRAETARGDPRSKRYPMTVTLPCDGSGMVASDIPVRERATRSF
jgi:hypothetical protein